MHNISLELVKSWALRNGNVNSNEDVLRWIEDRNSKINVSVEKVEFSYNGFWYYDKTDGYIKNKNNSFFQLAGLQEIEGDKIIAEQPIIIQNEIGYLGIICKMIDGCLNFLMQAKIEPGNINVVQISPTLQATKSNFTLKHGGKAPAYLSFFLNAKDHKVLVDQIQSEQSSRFYKKRNRNIILLVEDDVPVLESHMWMTLGQIKEMMKRENLVNMDTRTVISCLLFSIPQRESAMQEIQECFHDYALFSSIFKRPDFECIHNIFSYINEEKMFGREKSRLLPLSSLKGWEINKREIVCKTPYDFKVIYCRIEIEGREVYYWEQPLIEACGKAVFGIFTCDDEGIKKYLVRVKHEIGCFDNAELGPIVQLEPANPRNRLNNIESLFFKKLSEGTNIVVDVVLSEEGGRFYHEENRNVIIKISKEELPDLEDGFFWADYATISEMIQFNNCVNIQLRNLISLVDI